MASASTLWLCAAAVKLLLWPSYHSTDFEVHRNWLAVTRSTPASRWYADTEGQSEWTLDYPPLFAAFEAALAAVAQRVDEGIIDAQRRGYAPPTCVLFQRATVVVTEFVVLRSGVGFATRGCTAPQRRAAHVIFCGAGLASLVVVDHVHFQYNGMLLGLLAWLLGLLREERWHCAAAVFCAMLTMKHLFLSLAPCVAAVLAGAIFARRSARLLASLAATTAAALAAGLAPLAVPAFLGRGGVEGVAAALAELLRRLFPFEARGLMHSYWAPNAWALYATADRAALKVLGSAARAGSGAGTTRGRVDAGAGFLAVLPSPTPAICAALSLAAMAPALYALFAMRHPRGAGAAAAAQRHRVVLASFAHAALSAFLFGWHVHEKFLLVALVPLALLAVEARDRADVDVFRHAARLATFAALPLLPASELPLKVLLVAVEECTLPAALLDAPGGDACCAAPPVSRGGARRALESLHVLALAALFALKELAYPLLLSPEREAALEFLPLMLISAYGGAVATALWLVSAARLSRDIAACGAGAR